MELEGLFGPTSSPPAPAGDEQEQLDDVFDELPVGSPRLQNFYVGRAGAQHPEFNVLQDLDKAPHSPNVCVARLPEGVPAPHTTPHQKVIARGDIFLHSTERAYFAGMPGYSPRSPINENFFDIGFAPRAPLSPEQDVFGFFSERENVVNAADLPRLTLLRALTGDNASEERTGHEPRPGPSHRRQHDTRLVTRATATSSAAPMTCTTGEVDLAGEDSPETSPASPTVVPSPPSSRDASASPTPSHPDLQAGVDDDQPTLLENSFHPPRTPPPRSPHVLESSHPLRASRPSQRRGPRSMSQERMGTPKKSRLVPRRVASSALGRGAFTGAQADSDSPPSEDEFRPSTPHVQRDTLLLEEGEQHLAEHDAGDDLADANADDGDNESPLPAPRKDKGKQKQRNASAGPSNSARGRPTIQVNQEIEEVAHRMQGELVVLASKLGLSYETLLRKMGFTQQEVRDPNLSNVFKQVHKQRLRASGQRKPSHSLLFFSNYRRSNSRPECWRV